MTTQAPPPSYSSPSGQQTATVGPRNGLGTAALVLGIIAVLLCWTVIGGVVLGLLAVAFGLVGRGRVKRNEATNGGAATGGLVLGAIGVVIAIVLVIAGASFLNHHKKAIDNLQSCLNKAHTQSQRTSCDNQFKKDFNGS